MSKKLFLVFVCFICAIICVACKPILKQYDKNISEIRSNLYESNQSTIIADAITGYREEPFEIDGIATKRQPFTVITIYPTEYSPSKKYTYKAILDEIEYTGEMLKHPFNNTYSAEISAFTSSSDISLSLTHEGTTTELTLSSIIQPSFISADKAMEIAVKKLNSSIRSLKNSETSYEVYIRLIKNPVSSSGGYHWYVAFLGENDVTYAVLIDPLTLDIVAIRD